MRRRSGSGKFGPDEGLNEEINPLDGVANLADVMLVFACGIMLALITYWNVDVAATANQTVDIPSEVEITEDISGADSAQEQLPDDEGLEQYGVLYRDPATGRFYVMTEGEHG